MRGAEARVPRPRALTAVAPRRPTSGCPPWLVAASHAMAASNGEDENSLLSCSLSRCDSLTESLAITVL